MPARRCVTRRRDWDCDSAAQASAIRLAPRSVDQVSRRRRAHHLRCCRLLPRDDLWRRGRRTHAGNMISGATDHLWQGESSRHLTCGRVNLRHRHPVFGSCLGQSSRQVNGAGAGPRRHIARIGHRHRCRDRQPQPMHESSPSRSAPRAARTSSRVSPTLRPARMTASRRNTLRSNRRCPS